MEAVVGDDLTAGRERRMRLEHAQIMQESDISRAVKLGGKAFPEHLIR
jgi:predicted amidohydrolase YtcJ